MKRKTLYIILAILFTTLILTVVMATGENGKNESSNENIMRAKDQITLPDPSHEGVSFEETLKARRSERNYEDAELTKEELSQILWSAQGITDPARGFRTSPSAGATYPLDIFVDIKGVEGLNPGVYRYEPEEHSLRLKSEGSKRESIYEASLRQGSVRDAPVLIVIAGVYDRITPRYGERGVRYAHIEAGHISQNIYLQATSLGLGTVAIGAFEDERIKEILELGSEPLYLMPVGRIAR